MPPQVNALPNKLQAVNVPIIDYQTCAEYYSEDQDYSPVIETQICAGFEEGGKDACQVRLVLPFLDSKYRAQDRGVL